MVILLLSRSKAANTIQRDGSNRDKNWSRAPEEGKLDKNRSRLIVSLEKISTGKMSTEHVRAYPVIEGQVIIKQSTLHASYQEMMWSCSKKEYEASVVSSDERRRVGMDASEKSIVRIKQVRVLDSIKESGMNCLYVNMIRLPWILFLFLVFWTVNDTGLGNFLMWPVTGHLLAQIFRGKNSFENQTNSWFLAWLILTFGRPFI